MVQEPKSFFEKHPSVTLTMVVVFLFVLIDFLSGMLFIPKNYNSFRTKHYYYHHGLVPNYSGITAWGNIYYPIYTNSLGFRDRCVRDVPLQSSKKRILFLGDSQTEAVGLTYENSFVGLISKALDTNKVEVLNASAISYSPKIEYLKARYLMEYVGLKFDELIVTIDISDLQNEIVYQQFNPNENIFWNEISYNTMRFLKNHSFVTYSFTELLDRKEKIRFFEKTKQFDSYRTEKKAVRNIQDLYSTFFSDFNDDALLSNPNFHGVANWYYDSTFIKLADKGIKSGEENILKLKDLCTKNKVHLIVTVHPWQMQVYKRNPEDYYVRSWRNFANENHIDFINLFPVFINNINPEKIINDYFILNDNHWNEKGNKAIAREFLKYLK